MNQKPTEITITNRTVVRVIVIIAATFLGFRFVSNISHQLTLIFIAFFLAMALNPAVSWISKKLRIKSRAAATGIAYVCVLAVLTAFFVAVVPPLFNQTREFVASLPETVESLRDTNSGLGKVVSKYGLEDTVDNIASDMRKRFNNLPAPVISTASRIGSGIISTIAVLVMTFMMLVEGPYWFDKILKLQKAKDRQHRKELALKMYRVVTNYVNGQLLIAVIAACFALVAMMVMSSIFNVSINALGLAGIIAMTGLIPMIGNTIGAVIVVLVCAFTSFPMAIAMMIFFLVYQQIENVTIQPYIQSRKNELSPLLVFIAALCGIGLGGLIGGFVAIPLAACLRILTKDYYDHKVDSAEKA